MMASRRFWERRRVAVTGGTGFLGRHLVKRLLELGAYVRVYGLRPAPHCELPLVECRWGDILDDTALSAALHDRQVVFHTAGPVAMRGPLLHQQHDIHVGGIRNVLRVAPLGCRIVHTSSVVAVGATFSPDGILDENSEYPLEQTRVHYVRAKRDAELEALAAASLGQNVVVVNPGYMIGPDDLEPSVMGKFCWRYWKGRIPFAPPGGINVVDVRDVAEGHLLAAEHGQIGRRYILGHENHSWPSLMNALACTANLRRRYIIQASSAAMALVACAAHLRELVLRHPASPSFQQVRMNRYYWYYHSQRAVQELGFAPRPLRETMQDLYTWFIEERGLCVRSSQSERVRPAA